MILTGPDFTTGAFKRPGGVGFADDMVIMALQCATQWDALSQGSARTSCYTEIMGLRNVTITLDEDVVRWARIRAAERETSVSRLVGELLREKMLEDQSYEAAMREYLTRPARKLKKTGTKYPRRADLYGR